MKTLLLVSILAGSLASGTTFARERNRNADPCQYASRRAQAQGRSTTVGQVCDKFLAKRGPGAAPQASGGTAPAQAAGGLTDAQKREARKDCCRAVRRANTRQKKVSVLQCLVSSPAEQIKQCMAQASSSQRPQRATPRGAAPAAAPAQAPTPPAGST